MRCTLKEQNIILSRPTYSSRAVAVRIIAQFYLRRNQRVNKSGKSSLHLRAKGDSSTTFSSYLALQVWRSNILQKSFLPTFYFPKKYCIKFNPLAPTGHYIDSHKLLFLNQLWVWEQISGQSEQLLMWKSFVYKKKTFLRIGFSDAKTG